MTVAIRVIGAQMPGGLAHCPESDRFLMNFDVAAHNGRAPFPTTIDIRLAKHFPDPAAALEFWRTQSRVRPLRPDGEANRPLTAFTVEVVQVEGTRRG